MKSSVKRMCWFSIPAITLISIGTGCGKSAQEQAFETSASAIQAQPDPVQVEIILKDRRAINSSVETAPQMPSTPSANLNTQWGQASAQQGRYGAQASGGPGFGNAFGGRYNGQGFGPGYAGQGYGRPGLGGPGVGGSLAGDPRTLGAGAALADGVAAPGVGGPGIGGPFGGPGVGGPLGGPGLDGAFGRGFGGPGGFGGFGTGLGFAGPGVPFGPGPYGVFEPTLLPYQPFVVEDVVGDWGDDDNCDRRENKRRKGCKKDGCSKKEWDGNLKATQTGHLLAE